MGGAAAVENGGDPGGIGSLVSRLEWSELMRARTTEDQEAESSLAASAPDGAALRAHGLLHHEGGSPDGASTPTYDGHPRISAAYDIPADD